jgi:DNA-binding PadR family transcriptional regulator
MLADMKRKPGALLSIEIAILQAGIALAHGSDAEFHGYAMARAIRDQEGARSLTAHGTLYRALERLEVRGLLASRWEDPGIAAAEERPRRRLYRVTAEGEAAVQTVAKPVQAPAKSLKRGLAAR